MLSGAGNAAIIVVLEDEVEPCRHLYWVLQDSSPTGWKRLCFWEERKLLEGRCFLPPREQAAVPCPAKAVAVFLSSTVSCLLFTDSAWAVLLTMPSTWQVHLRVMQQFVLGKKVGGFFWERSHRVYVTGKREVNYGFFNTLNSSITPADCFVTQLTATLESAAKLLKIFTLFPVKHE